MAGIRGSINNCSSHRGEGRSRVMLYAGERQNVPIVTHGPFVGETSGDLVRLSQGYAQGHMPRVSELPGA
ncbi:MAG: hypothetical protein DMF89_10280 [Acidobacteria bacterium]|nr:MAG: hypothetical protein DMF89_10280 [Acidobacteriota bacterium]